MKKEYNVQELANKVKEKIETVYETKTRYVNIDLITAQEIVDVLENLMVKDLSLYVGLVNTERSARN